MVVLPKVQCVGVLYTCLSFLTVNLALTLARVELLLHTGLGGRGFAEEQQAGCRTPRNPDNPSLQLRGRGRGCVLLRVDIGNWDRAPRVWPVGHLLVQRWSNRSLTGYAALTPRVRFPPAPPDFYSEHFLCSPLRSPRTMVAGCSN